MKKFPLQNDFWALSICYFIFGAVVRKGEENCFEGLILPWF